MSDEIPERAVSEFDEPPTRTRFVVLGVLCLLSGIFYLDRVCIGAAIDPIQKELNLSNTHASYILNAFLLAYGLFEVPTGRWGDRIGARRVITRISIWWSAFTALTGACNGLGSLMTVRFLFGAGEAGAFPNVARVLSHWFPDHERGRAQGAILAASQIGAALAPYLAAVLIQTYGWRMTFVLFGCVGAVWSIGFWWWFRDDPATHASVNKAEAAYIGCRATAQDVHPPIPWRKVLRNPSVWFLGTIMTLASFNSYIYMSWLPKYLKAGRGVDELQAGMMTSVVLAFSAAGTILGGFAVDRIVRGVDIGRRRLMGGSGFALAAAMLGCALQSADAWQATVFAGISCLATQATLPLWWSCAIGISGRHVGALFGLMNSAGVFGGMTSQFLVGWIADQLGKQQLSGRAQWDPIFYIDLGVLLTAALLWSSFRFVVVEPVEQEESTRLATDH